jgi:methionine-rich copper-binding protein CopC
MSPSRSLCLATTLLLTALAMVFGLAAPAAAHTELISTDPEPGAILPTPPREVTLTFTDQMSGEFDTLSLIVADTEPIPLEAVTDGNVVLASIPIQKVRERGLDGRVSWKLVYRVVSADGHPVAGEVDFEAPLQSRSAPSASPSEAPTSAASPQATTGIGEEQTPSSQGASTKVNDPSDDSSPTMLNRPGKSGDSIRWEGWSHVREYVEEVSGRAA